MALNNLYKERQKGKTKKDIYMSLNDFIKEHENLIKVLKNGSKEELLKEAKEQQSELNKKTK